MKERLKQWFIEGFLKALIEGKPNIRFRLIMGEINAYFRRCNEMETKKWWKSRTVWFNILSGIVGTIVSLQSDQGLSPAVQKALGGVVLGGNLVLRFLTDKPIEGK